MSIGRLGNLGDNCAHYPNLIENEEMLRLWHAGYDTLEIARKLMLPECVVYSHLPILRAREAQEQEWNIDKTGAKNEFVSRASEPV